MELLKLISVNEIVAQLVCFFIVLFILRKFVWGQLLSFLDERKAKIAAEFKQIEDLKVQLADLRKDYEAKLDGIEQQARARINEAMDEGNRLAVLIRQQAGDDARKLIDNANQNIRMEMAKVKEELKASVVGLAMEAAEKVAGQKLGSLADKEMVQEFIREIEKSK
jgi:F-type H+-transporting ATPase subunit b